MNEELNRTPQDFKHRVIFMWMYNDIDRTRRDDREVCLNYSSSAAQYAKCFSMDIGQSSDLDVKSSGALRLPINQMDYGTKLRNDVGFLQSEPSSVVQRNMSFSRGKLTSKGGGKTSIHFNADPHIAELLLLSTVFVNQLSIYRAYADWCQELTQRAEAYFSQSTGRPVAEMTGDKAQHVPSEVVSSPTSLGTPGAAKQRKGLGAARQVLKCFCSHFSNRLDEPPAMSKRLRQNKKTR